MDGERKTCHLCFSASVREGVDATPSPVRSPHRLRRRRRHVMDGDSESQDTTVRSRHRLRRRRRHVMDADSEPQDAQMKCLLPHKAIRIVVLPSYLWRSFIAYIPNPSIEPTVSCILALSRSVHQDLQVAVASLQRLNLTLQRLEHAQMAIKEETHKHLGVCQILSQMTSISIRIEREYRLKLAHGAVPPLTRLPDESAPAALICFEHHRSAFARRNMLVALGCFGEAALPVLPEIVARLTDGNIGVRSGALKTLRKLDPCIKQLVAPFLARLLGNRSTRTQDIAFEALQDLGPHMLVALPELKKLVGSKFGTVRQAVAAALGVFGVEGADVFPELLKFLSDPDTDVSKTATTSLKDLGDSIAPAVPTLVQLVARPGANETMEIARVRAVSVLSCRGELLTDHVPMFCEFLSSPQWDIRLAGAELLGCVGLSALSAVPALKTLLHDSDLHVGNAAYDTLKKLGKLEQADIPQWVAKFPMLRNKLLQAPIMDKHCE